MGKMFENDKSQIELDMEKLWVIGASDASYPLSKKFHSLDYLRTIPYIRNRTRTFGAVMRIRNVACMAFHNYFQSLGLIHLHSPIITSIDCEGGGEQFEVHGSEKKFFGKDREKVYLTVSGQLHAEIFAAGLPGVYTFGPTFRAEKSDTVRHLSEFWMIEPEIAFKDLNGMVTIATQCIKDVARSVLEQCSEDLEMLEKLLRDQLSGEKSGIANLTSLVDSEFARLEYSEAVEILQRSNHPFTKQK